MRNLKDLLETKESLKQVKAFSIFELTILYTLEVLERNKGNRTKASEDLKIGVRTLRKWLEVMRVWGLSIPEYQYDPKIRSKPKTKYPDLKNYIKRRNPVVDKE